MLNISRPNASANPRKIAICGAGIGGLTLAIRLAELGHQTSVFERREEADIRSEGVFLTLAPNGMNGLKAVGCYDAVRGQGVETTGIEICNARGKRLGYADQADYERSYGAPSVTVSRRLLAGILIERARAVGVDLRFSTPLAILTSSTSGARLEFADGASFDADIVVGADGLRSTVRGQIFPDYPAPHFTGLIGTGAITPTSVPSTRGTMRMTFGETAFFGYLIDAGQSAFWFTSYSAGSPSGEGTIDGMARAERIRQMHAGDPEPNRTILSTVDAVDRPYPIFDMPELPAWSKERVVLLGDAAHAVGPHAGQGASMAIEDALVLAACLQTEADHRSAFRRYEDLRRPRIAQVVKLTARSSSQKRASGRWRLFIRDLILPIFIPLSIRAGRKLLSYRADEAPLGLRTADTPRDVMRA